MSCERRFDGTDAARGSRGKDAGMGLVETAIALMLVALIVLSVGAAIDSTGSSLRQTRLQEQATQLALEGIEWARGVDWSQLSLDPAAETDDPNIDAVQRTLLGASFGLEADEPLVEGGESPLIPPVYQETLDGTPFTIRSYVTEAGYLLRRATVVVSWESEASSHRHVASTIISEVSAG